jgi:hypothetical protein
MIPLHVTPLFMVTILYFPTNTRFRIACPRRILQKQQIHMGHNRMQQAMRGETNGVPVENLCSSVRRVDINGDWTATPLQAADTKPPFFQETLSHV